MSESEDFALWASWGSCIDNRPLPFGERDDYQRHLKIAALFGLRHLKLAARRHASADVLPCRCKSTSKT
jgi:hypothetical protein